jgi:hypothetical protein
LTAAGVLKECDFSEADSVTFLLARGFSGYQGAPEEIGRTLSNRHGWLRLVAALQILC